MAARHGATLPVIEATLADYAKLLATGHGEEDISTIFRLKVSLFAGPASDG
jgi:3-hydroxyisobutyrate dehydrogenase